MAKSMAAAATRMVFQTLTLLCLQVVSQETVMTSCTSAGGDECETGVQSASLMQRQASTKLSSSNLSQDDEDPLLNITGEWVGEEMTGAATVIQHGEHVQVINPKTVWSPATGVIKGNSLHFEFPEMLKGERADVRPGTISIGGIELSRLEAVTVDSQLLERAASRSGLGAGSLDQAVKTKCAYKTHQNGGQPDIRKDSWKFVFSVKPKSDDIMWPIPCSHTDGTPWGECKKFPHEDHHHCLREGHSSKQWDQEDWGYCRVCPASAVTPKCAYYAAPDGKQNQVRTDKWSFVFSKKPNTEKYPVECSSTVLGRCEPIENWDRKNFKELYCLRKGHTTKQWNKEDWGYCRDCPADVVNKHILKEMYKETLYSAYFDKAGQQCAAKSCWGDGQCCNGLVCILQKCRTPPLSPWSIADAVNNKYNARDLQAYVQKLKIYHGRVMRDTNAILANYAQIEILDRERNNKKVLLAMTSAKIGTLDAQAEVYKKEGNTAKARRYKQARDKLKNIQKRHHDDFDILNEKIGDARAVVREQAKQVAGRREIMEARLEELQAGRAKGRFQRSNNIADLDAEANDNLKKKKGSRGGLIGYEKSDTQRFSELKFNGGKSLFFVEGQYVLTAGACPEGVCASAGASVSVAVEHTLLEDNGRRLFTTSKARVYGNVDAQAGCGASAGGCKLALSATAGVSVEQEIKYQQDLGNGVTMDSTAAVEAGVVAKADAVAGCTTKSGCRVKAKAFAGAYVKASASQRVGNEDVAGEVGGSVMAGAGAGGSADIEANYDGGKISLGGELCGMVGVGLCGNVKIEVDVAAVEDLAEGFAEEMNNLGKEGGKVASLAAAEASKGALATAEFVSNTANDLAKGAEDGFHAAAEEIDKVGGTLEGGYNAVTEELGNQVENLAAAPVAIAQVIAKPEKPAEVLATVVTTVLPLPPAAPVQVLASPRRRRSHNPIDFVIGLR